MRWQTVTHWKWKLANAVGSQYSSHYLGTWCIQHYYRWCEHLGCQQSTELTPPGRFKWTRFVLTKEKIWFLWCAITFQLTSTTICTYLSLNNTWLDCKQPKCNIRRQRGTLWLFLSIRRNKILQPVPKVITTKSTTQTNKLECLLQEQFQAPGITKQGRRRGVNWFARRKTIISFCWSRLPGVRD